MNARDKAYTGATAVFDAPQKRAPTDREIALMVEAMKLFKDCTVDEMASVLNGCILILGDRIVKERDAKYDRRRT
jgi:hypothetical protein